MVGRRVYCLIFLMTCKRGSVFITASTAFTPPSRPLSPLRESREPPGARRKPGKQHINKHKSTKRLKRLSKENHVDHSQIDHIIGMMPTSGIKRSTAKAATKPTDD